MEGDGSVCVIVLNWNGGKDTVECLESLLQMDYQDRSIVVVDNGSTDDSIETLRKYSRGEVKIVAPLTKHSTESKPLHLCEMDVELEGDSIGYVGPSPEHLPGRGFILLKSPRNEGFASGNNIGMDYARRFLKPRYILLLNNDTAVDRGLLRNLVSCASTIDALGIEGPSINFYDAPGTVSSAGGVLNIWNASTPQYGGSNGKMKIEKQVYDVDFVSGCAMFIDTRMFGSVEPFDGKFFLYWEDIDLCYRTKRAGYRIVCNRDAVVWHKVSQSFKKVSKVAAYYGHRNQIMFMRKHASLPQKATFAYYFLLVQFPYRLAKLLAQPGSGAVVPCFLRGIMDGFLDRSARDAP